MTDVALWSDVRAEVGETPLVVESQGLVCWVDLLEGHVLAASLHTGRSVDLQLDLGSAGFLALADQQVVAVVGAHVFRMDFEAQSLVWLFDYDLPGGLQPNDGGVDPFGRLWISLKATSPAGHGMVVAATPRVTEVVLDRVGLPNGIVFDSEHAVVYVADSAARCILRVPLESRSSRRRADTWLAFSDTSPMPDGLSLDSCGGLWIAEWGGGAVRRYRLSDSAVDDVVVVPTPLVTASCIGEDGTIFVTTSGLGTTREADPLSGRLFRTAATDHRPCATYALGAD